MSVEPLRWSDDELEEDRQLAIERFREARLQEPLEQYLEVFDTYRGVVEDLLETTVDLTQLAPPDLEVLTNDKLLVALRYLAGPPVSADDLKEIAKASLAPSRLREDADMAQRVVDTILTALDRRRFPWVAEDREPEPAEREAAALASAALIATQVLNTERRHLAKRLQEESVADALSGADFQEVPTRTITSLSDAPRAGEFCRESMFGTRKADFVVGLWDGRTMPIECKVSNSSTNSVKRLNNDAAAKATRWIEEFGTVQTVPAAVIGGVFKAHNLRAAQQSGLTLFWAHDLDAMTEWLQTTR